MLPQLRESAQRLSADAVRALCRRLAKDRWIEVADTPIEATAGLDSTPDAPAMRNPYREITMTSWKKARPIQALYELTYRCNHLCTFCNNPLSREGSELR